MRIPMLVLIAALSVAGCKKLEPKAVTEAKAERDESRDRRIRQACASQASYDRLKVLAFEKAAEVRSSPSPLLDQLATSAVVRMEEPTVKSRDEALNVTVCRGKMVIDLPPGTEDAFNGERQLSAEVEYAAQAAADGSGLLYQLDGAEPIIYRLAAIDMKGAPVGPAPLPTATPEPAPPVQTAKRAPAPPPAAQPPRPRPTPARPTRRPAPPPVVDQEEPRPALARPSFNCRYARTRTEQMVCSDERLAARDRTMASQYYSAIAASDRNTRAVLRGTRDRFLAERERCRTARCVADVYEDRVDEIDRIMAER